MHLALLISTVQQREKQNYSLSRFHGQLNGFYIPFKDKNDWVAPNTSSHISSPGARFLNCILDQSFKNFENDTCNETFI